MKEKKPTEQWISFILGRETYVHAIDCVREIIPHQPAIPVPGAAAEVEGVLNVRGEVVPVLSGRRLLDLAEQPPDDNCRVIILDTSAGLVGLSVDSVREIVAFPEAAIEAAQTPVKHLVKGTCQQGHLLLIVLDLADHCSGIASNNIIGKKIGENG